MLRWVTKSVTGIFNREVSSTLVHLHWSIENKIEVKKYKKKLVCGTLNRGGINGESKGVEVLQGVVLLTGAK